MKKSEMIKIISDIMIKYEYKDRDDFGSQEEADEYNEKVGTIGYGATHESVASKVLDELLKLGMFPPSIEFTMGITTVRDNCWEQE